MQIKVSQAIPGTILLEDVIGKTGRPIITKQTILTEKHIEVLQRFLIDKIHVSTQLEDGSSFVVHRKSNGPQEITSPFYESLKQSVNSYHEQFIDWENRQSVDIARLRHTFLPLFEQTKHLDIKDLMGYHEILLKNTFYSKQIFKSLLAIILARLVNCEQGELNQVGLAGLLSDSGMIKYDDNVYEIPNQLYNNSYEQMKHHPIYSYRLIEDSPLLTKATKMGVLQHHERIDGDGYPLQLSDKEIHRIAKIIGVSDEFTKALSFYLTNSKFPIKQSIVYLREEGLNKLDREIMTILITQLIENP